LKIENGKLKILVGKKVLCRTNFTFPTVFVLICFANHLYEQNSIKEQFRRGGYHPPVWWNLMFIKNVLM